MDTTPIVPQANKKSWGAPAIIVTFVVLFIIVVLMYIGGASLNQGSTPQAVSEEKTVVYKGDVNASLMQDKLPQGFPMDIPVETAMLEESVKVDYTERGATQYSVVYLSEKSKDEVTTTYIKFFSDNGYQITPQQTGLANTTQLYGQKNNDDLSVVIESTDAGNTRVLLTFLDRG